MPAGDVPQRTLPEMRRSPLASRGKKPVEKLAGDRSAVKTYWMT